MADRRLARELDLEVEGGEAVSRSTLLQPRTIQRRQVSS